ncbi:MAG: AtpZ/AtpI family protein [Nitrospiraceae bacterium]|nr:AtpZ/AtpI family protein [Nitrospiraceae bacterium]
MSGSLFSKESIRAWSVGLNLVVSTFVGLAIGYGLDRLFSTNPWLTIIFLILGIISGFRDLYRFAQRQNNGSDSSDKDK